MSVTAFFFYVQKPVKHLPTSVLKQVEPWCHKVNENMDAWCATTANNNWLQGKKTKKTTTKLGSTVTSTVASQQEGHEFEFCYFI